MRSLQFSTFGPGPGLGLILPENIGLLAACSLIGLAGRKLAG
jgi:hypothetical protein